jgi:hypothetical protein
MLHNNTPIAQNLNKTRENSPNSLSVLHLRLFWAAGNHLLTPVKGGLVEIFSTFRKSLCFLLAFSRRLTKMR